MEGLSLSFCYTNLLSFYNPNPSSTTLCAFQLAVRRHLSCILPLSVDESFVGRMIRGIFGTIDPRSLRLSIGGLSSGRSLGLHPVSDRTRHIGSAVFAACSHHGYWRLGRILAGRLSDPHQSLAASSHARTNIWRLGRGLLHSSGGGNLAPNQ
jgi:hypothetical protein